VSERELNMRARDLTDLHANLTFEMHNRRSERWIKCPRPKAYSLRMLALLP